MSPASQDTIPSPVNFREVIQNILKVHSILQMAGCSIPPFALKQVPESDSGKR